MHGNPSDDEIDRVVAFDDLGVSEPEGDVIVWDFRARTATRLGADGQWRVRVRREEWTYLVLAPIFGKAGSPSSATPASSSPRAMPASRSSRCRRAARTSS